MKIRMLFSASLALALACSPTLFAAEKKSEKKPQPAAEKAPDPGKPADAAKPSRPLPFTGKVTAVDAGGKSFSLKGRGKDRVFAVTEKTVFLDKENAPAKIADIKVGDDVRGSALKNGDDWTAQKVILGAKEKVDKAPADSAKKP